MAVIQVPPDSSGKAVDTVTLSDAGVEVHRQKLVVAGGSGTAEIVVVTNAAAGAADMGLVVRHAGTATIAGTVNVNGGVAVSGTATIAGSVVISGTATVAGVVGLTAGTANIGNLDFISRTVQVAVGTPFTLNNISATVTVAGNINISATAPVAGTLNISGSVVVAGSVGLFTTAESPSASRGPRCIIASTSSTVILASAPGAGLSIFVTSIAVSNASGSNTRARVGSSATPGNVTMLMAQSGGGFVMNFAPPWQLSANEALLVSVKPNASEGIFNAHFFVGSSDSF